MASNWWLTSDGTWVNSETCPEDWILQAWHGKPWFDGFKGSAPFWHYCLNENSENVYQLIIQHYLEKFPPPFADKQQAGV